MLMTVRARSEGLGAWKKLPGLPDSSDWRQTVHWVSVHKKWFPGRKACPFINRSGRQWASHGGMGQASSFDDRLSGKTL